MVPFKFLGREGLQKTAFHEDFTEKVIQSKADRPLGTELQGSLAQLDECLVAINPELNSAMMVI